MATVGTTTFLEDGDRNYILLNNNEQYLRQFNTPLGMFWSGQGTNIGVLYAIDTTAATTQITGGMWLGLTTSATPGVGIKQGFAANRRAIGAGYGLAAAKAGALGGTGGWTYRPITGDISGSTLIVPSGFQRSISASVSTGGGSAVAGGYLPTTEAPMRKQIFYVGLYQFNSATLTYYTCLVYGVSGGGINYSGSQNHNHTNNTFFSTLTAALAENADYAVDGANQYSTLTTSQLWQATDDINYPLDTVNVFWTGSCPIRIYNIAVGIVR